MSISAINHVLTQSKSTLGARLTLIGLANHADDDGVCWPSQRRIETLTQLSERQVRRAIAALEESGELIAIRGGGREGSQGRGATSVYILRLGRPAREWDVIRGEIGTLVAEGYTAASIFIALKTQSDSRPSLWDRLCHVRDAAPPETSTIRIKGDIVTPFVGETTQKGDIVTPFMDARKGDILSTKGDIVTPFVGETTQKGDILSEKGDILSGQKGDILSGHTIYIEPSLTTEPSEKEKQKHMCPPRARARGEENAQLSSEQQERWNADSSDNDGWIVPQSRVPLIEDVLPDGQKIVRDPLLGQTSREEWFGKPRKQAIAEEKAEKAERAGLDKRQYRIQTDLLLEVQGLTAAVQDDNNVRFLWEAQDAAIGLATMGYKTPDQVKDLVQGWMRAHPGKVRPTGTQLNAYASALLADARQPSGGDDGANVGQRERRGQRGGFPRRRSQEEYDRELAAALEAQRGKFSNPSGTVLPDVR